MVGLVFIRGVLPRLCQRLILSDVLLRPQICSVHLQQTLLDQSPLLGFQSWRGLHQSTAMHAGHNKWSKVKNVKGPKDVARSQMFMKFAMMIRVAVKEGGSNPEFNVQLANLIEQCRSKNMPKASIEAAIKGSEKSKAGSYSLYEARGPGGSMLLIEVLTDNNARSHQEVKHLIHKHGGTMCDGARHSFEKKGVVLVSGGSMSPERALELAVEVGAEDVQETEDEERTLLQFVCEVSALREVRSALEDMGIPTLSAGLEFVSHSPALLPLAQLEASSRLLDALNDSPDVIRVWDNIKWQD